MDISVVIPTYNLKDKLAHCLQSLFQQDYPTDNFEIIVVDDGSFDNTENLLKELSVRQANLRYFRQPHRGPAAARNFGIKISKSDIVAFTDADCVLPKNWVSNMAEAHGKQDNVMAIGGFTKVNYKNTKAIVSQFLSNGAININIMGNTEVIFFPTCNVSIKKRYLGQDGFKEIFTLPAGEDAEFFWRFFKKGHRFSYRQEIEIFHDCNSSIRSFLRQAYMYGRGNYLVQYIHQDHPLFKEIKAQDTFSFLLGLIINFIKIPRFSYLLGRRLIKSEISFSLHAKMEIYFYFVLHKIMYLFGNITEHFMALKISEDINLFHQEQGRGPVRPEFIILDLTHRCNLKCNICQIRKDKPIREFTTGEVKDLILQTAEWGLKEFVLSGGEPFIRDDIFEILNFVREQNYHIGILTNGTLLNEEVIKRLSPYLTSNTLSLSISLDSLTPAIHDDIRGSSGCFEKTFNALKTFSALKNKSCNINFNVISIILNENLEELLPLARLLKTMNINSVQFQPLLANNLIMEERSNKIKYWVSEERLLLLDRTIDTLIEFKQQNTYFIRNSESNLRLVKRYFRGTLDNNDVKCLYATKTMLIANNGDVTTCFDCYGNVRNAPLKRIFHSPLAKLAREKAQICQRPCLLPCFCD